MFIIILIFSSAFWNTRDLQRCDVLRNIHTGSRKKPCLFSSFCAVINTAASSAVILAFQFRNSLEY